MWLGKTTLVLGFNDKTFSFSEVTKVIMMNTQVNKMICLEEMHIRNLKVRSLAMATLLLDNLPNLKKASNWWVITFKK